MSKMNLMDLPLNWRIVRFAEVTTFTKKPKGLRYSEYNEVPFVPMNLIPIAKLYSKEFNLKSTDELSSGTYFEPGDILLAKITPSFENGKQSIIEDLPTPFGIATTEVIPIREVEGISDKIYLFYYLLVPDVRALLAARMKGTTGRLRLGTEALANLEVPLPPLAEQRRIVAKLEVLFTQLDAAVDSLRKAQEQLQRYRQSILKAAFEGELTKEWREEDREVAQLRDIVNLRRETVQPDDSNKELNFVGLKYIDSGVSTLKRWGEASEVKSTKARFYPNDVLYGRLNPHLDKAVIAEIEGICSTDILVFTANSKMIPRFLVYLLHSYPFRSHAMATASGITLPRTSWSALGEFTFTLPSLTEQEQIVSELERHLSVADAIEATLDAELKRAERLRQSILKQAFSGKPVPPDLNDEPASVLLEKIRDEKEHQQSKRKKTTPKSKTTLSGKQMLFPLN